MIVINIHEDMFIFSVVLTNSSNLQLALFRKN